jgi:hypothetical protein
MLKLHFFLFAIFSCSAATAAFGQSTVSDPGAKRICSGVSGIEVPAQDQPTPEEKKSLTGCLSEDLYYGFGHPADPAEARKCAYAEIDRGKDDLDIAGRAVLTMIYANGKGVERNVDLALKFACEMQGSPGDLAGNIYELQRFRNAPVTTSFSVCDHSAGPHLYKSCAILGDRFDKQERAHKISAITGQWTEKERKAFVPLQQAAEKFFKSRANTEINLEPTFEVQEMAFMENGFIGKLQQFEKGELPRFSTADSHKAQASLESAYAATQKDPNRRWGTATVEGVKNTQQLWLAYREAWVRFGRTKYPKVSPDSWTTWLTQERVAMLDRLLH